VGYYVRVEPDVNVFVEDINPTSQKAILFIHGWPASHNLYEYQFDHLPQMGYRCIGVDTRGFGNSDRPMTGYGYDRLADDVRAVVDALQLQNFVLAGHSMGGATAIRYMSRHNQYGVSRLALIGAAAPSVTIGPNFPYGIPASDVTKLVDGAYNDRPQMLQDFGNMFFFQNTTIPFKQWFLQIGLQAAGWATAQCAETFRDETLFADLPKITVPTLIIHGIHDNVCKFQLALALKAGILNSKLVPFEFSGHGTFWEERDKFNKELTEFIG
jgi:non-heme chloroperoxidase